MPDGDRRTDREDCYICGSGNADILERHHIVPQRFGGEDDAPNVVELCPTCHAALERLYDERFYDALSVTGPEDAAGTNECAWEGCTSTDTVFVGGVNGAAGIHICGTHRRCYHRDCGDPRVDAMPMSDGGVTLRCEDHQICRKDCGSTETTVYDTDYGVVTLCSDHAEENWMVDEGDVVQ